MTNTAILSGKAIVVTGAGAGLGKAYAEHLAQLGGKVVVNDIDGKRAEEVVANISRAGGASVAHVGSVTTFSVAEDLMKKCLETFGSVYALVNNAGIYYHSDPWDDPPERYQQLIEINVLGTIHCGVAFMSHLRKVSEPGVIVNVVSGSQCGLAKMAAYSASKGAVASLTYSWAADLAGSIRVNAVSPIGMSGAGERKDASLVAPVVAYLISDRSAEVSGQVFRMNPPEMSIMSHPGFFEDSVRVDHWNVEGIARVVADDLRKWFQPVGGVLCVKGESSRLLAPSTTVS